MDEMEIAKIFCSENNKKDKTEFLSSYQEKEGRYVVNRRQ